MKYKIEFDKTTTWLLSDNFKTIAKLYTITGEETEDTTLAVTWELTSPHNIIPEETFLDCLQLIEIENDDVIEVRDYAFQNCPALIKVSFSSVNTFGVAAFRDCSSLNQVLLPLATSFGENAFEGCSAMTDITLPSVTALDYNAFRDCSSLTTASFSSITTLEENAFQNCSSINTLSINPGGKITKLGSFSPTLLTSNVDLYIGNISETDPPISVNGTTLTVGPDVYIFKSIKQGPVSQRELGDFPISCNFDVDKAAPLDARMLMPKKSFLIEKYNWISRNGETFVYPGMLVVVYDDTIANNGLYRLEGQYDSSGELIPEFYTNPSNWILVGSDSTASIIWHDVL